MTYVFFYIFILSWFKDKINEIDFKLKVNYVSFFKTNITRKADPYVHNCTQSWDSTNYTEIIPKDWNYSLKVILFFKIPNVIKRIKHMGIWYISDLHHLLIHINDTNFEYVDLSTGLHSFNCYSRLWMLPSLLSGSSGLGRKVLALQSNRF